jgi:hypothetical protein
VNKLQISRNTHLRREKESKMNRHGEDQISWSRADVQLETKNLLELEEVRHKRSACLTLTGAEKQETHRAPYAILFNYTFLVLYGTFLIRYPWVGEVSDIKGGTWTEGVWEQGAGENIWTEEGWSDRRLEKTA